MACSVGQDRYVHRTNRWLNSLAHTDLTQLYTGINSLPVIGNVNPHVERSPGVWHIKGCTEVQVNGWYQPLVLNAAALALMKTSVAAYGVQATCKGFDVTHDIGVGVLAWMLGMYHVQIPGLETNPAHNGVSILKPKQVRNVGTSAHFLLAKLSISALDCIFN